MAIPALVLAGCSEKTPGTASSSTDTSTDSTSGTGTGKPSSTSKAPVVRPKTINLKGVDPCTLLTEAQRQALSLDRPPQAGKSEDFDGASSCAISKEDRTYIAGVIAVTEMGVEGYTNGQLNVDATPLRIGGFPAVLGKPTVGNGADYCFVGVDVSDGQHLAIKMMSVGETPQARLCELAPPVAEAAIATLMTK